ncbi:unnamed protein product [Brassicogethes aeneus]|uniref:Uncharacterized protein n=1 Tax=Brassicogethes aeneus TaxID=1431903 RepID=A0A9P0BIY1_BRAAE|nr:unnamed protein product [Brassicogethes aeneus]
MRRGVNQTTNEGMVLRSHRHGQEAARSLPILTGALQTNPNAFWNQETETTDGQPSSTATVHQQATLPGTSLTSPHHHSARIPTAPEEWQFTQVNATDNGQGFSSNSTQGRNVPLLINGDNDPQTGRQHTMGWIPPFTSGTQFINNIAAHTGAVPRNSYYNDNVQLNNQSFLPPTNVNSNQQGWRGSGQPVFLETQTRNVNIADVCKISRRALFEEWCAYKKNERPLKILLKIRSYLPTDIPEVIEQNLKENSISFCRQINKWWQECFRSRKKLEKDHAVWLNGTMTINLNKRPTTSPQGPSSSMGRPQKLFEELSQKSKIRRVEPLVKNHTSKELCFAAERSRRFSTTNSTTSNTITTIKAIALYYDLNLTVRKYEILRSVVNAMHPDCFPSYRSLLTTKNKYLPAHISVTETSAEVDLQELLEKTTISILNISNLSKCQTSDLKLICKWGFDGSSGHSLYKQKFASPSATDEYMFLTAMVPIQLIDRSKNIISCNFKTSSTFYCRPIKFTFIKECAEIIRQEEKNVVQSINALKTYEISVGDANFKVSFEMLFTMFDGSVANILSQTNSSAKCIICGATPKEMNLDTVLTKYPKVENYRFGISTLHCWIRFFECLLHIAYRLPIKTWQVKGEPNKAIFKNTKKSIQEGFKSKLHLIVDKPKPGCGSTNDGNTARKFFQNPQLSAEITGISKDLIIKFHTIIRVLVSGFKINVEKLKPLLNETRSLYLSLYNWYYMPSSVHKVLVHGCEIIDFFEFPIGQLSEDALEARHKEFRKIRLHNSRKTSRTDTNYDIIRNLIMSSDPELASLRQIKSLEKRSDYSDIKEYFIIEESLNDSGFFSG